MKRLIPLAVIFILIMFQINEGYSQGENTEPIRKINGIWDIEIFNQMHTGGVRSGSINIKQQGNSITFKSRYEVDNNYEKDITWTGTYKDSIFNVKSSTQYVTSDFGQSTKYSFTVTLKGYVCNDSKIRGTLKSMIIDGNIPNDKGSKQEKGFVMRKMH